MAWCKEGQRECAYKDLVDQSSQYGVLVRASTDPTRAEFAENVAHVTSHIERVASKLGCGPAHCSVILASMAVSIETAALVDMEAKNNHQEQTGE